MKQKKFKQISLKEIDWTYEDHRKNCQLAGKVIENAGFTNKGMDDNVLIIKFTDGTFIAVGVEWTQDDNHILDDFYVLTPESYGDGLFDVHANVYPDGNIIYDTWVQMLIDMGFWEIDDETVKRKREESRKRKDDREYAEYLRLKEKFKDRE